jgi:mannose-6-phosphate isomerase
MATNNYNLRPFRLKPVFVERVWGREDLKPWFEEHPAGKIGEAWLTGPDCVIVGGDEDGRTLASLSAQCVGTLDGLVGGGEFPLLVKMLFPNEKLSVQVHPDDDEARALGLSRGKTECWYVLDAVPGATVACGLKPGVTVEAVRKGIEDGTVESLLELLPVKTGEMILVEAGTVHAILPGVVLLEVQQTSDVTYRLFDYGRDRDLHLEDGLKVVKLKNGSGTVESVKSDTYTRLVDTKYFVVDRFEVPPGHTFEMEMDGVGCVVGLRGKLAVNEVRFGVGEAVVSPAGSVTISSVDGGVFCRCWERPA